MTAQLRYAIVVNSRRVMTSWQTVTSRTGAWAVEGVSVPVILLMDELHAERITKVRR